MKIIEDFCSEKGITRAREILTSPELFEEICKRLVHGVGLSLRKTAEHLETSHNRVHQALRDSGWSIV